MENDKSLFFLTISLSCIWIVLDNIWGKKYLSNFIDNLFNGRSSGNGGSASLGGGNGSSGGGDGGGTRSLYDRAEDAKEELENSYTPKSETEEHVNKYVAGLHDNTCPWCGKKFDDANVFNAHMINCTPASGLVDRFKPEDPLSHNETVAKAMNYTCPWCNKKFDDADEFAKHQASCTPGGAIIDKVIGFFKGGSKND